MKPHSSLSPSGGMEQLVSVVIQGEQYTIRAAEDSGYVQRVAQFVNKKLGEVVKKSPSIPSNKAIVLASLNIADELLKLEADREQSEALVAARLGELCELLGAELEEGKRSARRRVEPQAGGA